MRPLNVSLCDETYKLAKQKSNFSSWVRDQLRSERNKREAWKKESRWLRCTKCDSVSQWPSNEKYPLCRNKHCNGYGSDLIEVDNNL